MELICEHPAAKQRPPQKYQLSEADRLAIISETPIATQLKEIERQRQAFIALYGNQFGTE